MEVKTSIREFVGGPQDGLTGEVPSSAGVFQFDRGHVYELSRVDGRFLYAGQVPMCPRCDGSGYTDVGDDCDCPDGVD